MALIGGLSDCVGDLASYLWVVVLVHGRPRLLRYITYLPLHIAFSMRGVDASLSWGFCWQILCHTVFFLGEILSRIQPIGGRGRSEGRQHGEARRLTIADAMARAADNVVVV